MPEPPKPYVYNFTPCETHKKTNCPLCSVTNPVAQPNPDLSAPAKPPAGDPQVFTINTALPAPPPVLTDPKAQKIVEAARKYAQAVEAAAIISDQVAQTKELLAALEQKLEETKKDVEIAMKETQAI